MGRVEPYEGACMWCLPNATWVSPLLYNLVPRTGKASASNCQDQRDSSKAQRHLVWQLGVLLKRRDAGGACCVQEGAQHGAHRSQVPGEGVGVSLHEHMDVAVTGVIGPKWH